MNVWYNSDAEKPWVKGDGAGPGAVQTRLDALDKLYDERQFLTKVLRLWAHAKATTGLTEETIKAFTFRPEYLTKEEAREDSRYFQRNRVHLYTGKTHHNALRLHNGDVVPMPLIARPEPPGHMACSVEKK